MAGADLQALLADGEWAAFHGPPARAVLVLGPVIQAAADPAEAARARWLLGVAEQAAGRLDPALAALEPALEAAGPLGPPVAAAIASVHRQLGDHEAATGWDRRGLELAGPEGSAWPLLGLAADAVGRLDGDEAARQLELARPLAEAGDWRLQVRLGWVRAQLELLLDRPVAAAARAAGAVALAEQAAAAPAVAQGLLLEGSARGQAGDPEAVAALRRAAALAETLQAAPVAWSALAMLGALQARDGHAAEAAASFSAARAWLQVIVGHLDDPRRTRWLASPPVAGVLQAAAALQPSP
jgi:tetratricopeptide (TPR) repeat protein